VSTATKNNLKAIGNSSLMFTKVYDHGRVAFEAYMAIYRNDGDHLILAAPTLDALAESWEGVAGLPLNREQAQKVFIVSATSKLTAGQGPVPSAHSSKTSA
jgi:hypothetical protein